MKRLLFGLGFLGLLIFGIGLGLTRLYFVVTAENGIGAVESVSARNDSCGSRRNKRACTEFTASVAFKAKDGRPANLSMSAGSTDGHNMSVTHADLKVGSTVALLYRASDPNNALPNSLSDIWGGSLISICMSFFCLIPALRRR